MGNPWMDVSTGSGMRRRIRLDDASQLMVAEARQPNMKAILDQNHRELNEHSAKSHVLRNGETMTKVATIPFWLIEHWKVTEGLDFFNPSHRAGIFAKLNSNEYSKLRTAHGVITPETREV